MLQSAPKDQNSNSVCVSSSTGDLQFIASTSMEILNPSPPPSPSIHRFSAQHRLSVSTGSAPSSAGQKLHVAVGKSPEKTLSLLRWTFRRFVCTEIVLLHVYQPSPVIPTLLGKIPVNQATEELVRDYRKTEKAETRKILRGYLDYCHKSRVVASIVAMECDQIQNGIVDLVNQHGVRKLIVGSAPDNGFRLKGNPSKATFLAKNVPTFCEVWFVSKGRHVWTREAISAGPKTYSPDDSYLTKRIRFSVSSTNTDESENDPEIDQEAVAQDDTDHNISDASVMGYNKGATYSTKMSYLDNSVPLGGSSPSWPDSTADIRFQSQLGPKQDCLSVDLNEVIKEAERSRTEAFAELLRRKEIETETNDTLKRVKASEAAQAREAKSREELEDLLKMAKERHQVLINQREGALKELDSTMMNLSLLDLRAQELSARQFEAAAELEVLQSSIEIIQIERQKNTQNGRKELRQTGLRVPNYNMIGLGDDSHNFREFSLADIKAATCDFSESFKLFQGGNGTVYKGEMMNRSVAIKRLHPRNVQGLMEFQQEVFVLSKLRHPHLVSLLGACPEALCAVYEYFPNGTLQERLFSRGSNATPLMWRSRARIVSEIASALFFLHSSRPDKIVHGDLKPDNIFLDSDFRCKIGDFGICRLVPDDTPNFPMYQRSAGPRGSFPYMDPEYQRNELRSPKSDVYSFGIIVLQLLTGKPPLGLANVVRRAVVSGKLASVLDKTAGEWPTDVARWLAEFGLKCSDMNAGDRPDLTPEVVRELEQLHMMKERPVPTYFLCPILQEIMHDPQVAADGFTYEGRALRDWLENGRETSPMTNLKLRHVNLTPNHALRFAIQDWLCQS
ncbi:U-box domain-containing protein kinase family protein [Rhynchospora pubera]|uniref:RING-type E3 ubiquitin transferase n=1 Tax=Rhynchospora pubera TaxID=906938 RepID=A0AAV8HKI0_9POAL|nr:U-box domain-containing protein kinase family protein [Rhynchospora pubera]